MIDFALRWYRFGGGSDEDIFVRFGIDRLTYARRLLTALDDPRITLDPVRRNALRDVYSPT
ncbi:hypothetical protein AAFP30_11915 [Gordonia sp. CPCC 205515]|uniref:hypothetical protein n=1 Tax=Gordonia sp. CPCC 205515 TaxID=3140791 RepID=UPI003AF3A13C